MTEPNPIVPPTSTVVVTPPATKEPHPAMKVLKGAYTTTTNIAGRLIRKSRSNYKVEEVNMYSTYPLFFLWPLIVFGWLAGLVITHFPNHASGWTWAWEWLIFYSFLMLSTNIGTLKLVIYSVVFALIVVTTKYIEAVRHIILFGHLFNHFRHLHPIVSGGVPSVLSWFMAIPWVIMAVETYRSGHKTFSPNQIEERSIGVGREVTDRSTLHFICSYPNLLKTLLGFGSGTITAMDGNGNVKKEWHDLIALYFLWPRLDEILHQRSVGVDNSKNDPVEVLDEKLVATTAAK